MSGSHLAPQALEEGWLCDLTSCFREPHQSRCLLPGAGSSQRESCFLPATARPHPGHSVPNSGLFLVLGQCALGEGFRCHYLTAWGVGVLVSTVRSVRALKGASQPGTRPAAGALRLRLARLLPSSFVPGGHYQASLESQLCNLQINPSDERRGNDREGPGSREAARNWAGP